MPSSKPVIAVRLHPIVHARIEKAALEQGRSVANLVAFELQKVYGGPPSTSEKMDQILAVIDKSNVRAQKRVAATGRQVDLKEVTGGIAAAVKRGPVRSK
jgi:hypothetical protein